MKHLSAIILLLCILQQAYCRSVPDWFLKPDQSEYTGVSLPSDTVSVRESSAIASAILKYCLTDYPERPGTLIEISHDSSGNETTKSLCELDTTIPFEISRSYTNSQGETFVAIKINRGAKSYCRLSVFKQLEKTEQLEMTDRITIQGCHDNQMFEYLITHNGTDTNTDIKETLMVEARTVDTFVTRHFDIEHDIEHEKYIYMDTKNYLVDYFSCDNSLYLSHTQYLIELLGSFTLIPQKHYLSINNNYLEVNWPELAPIHETDLSKDEKVEIDLSKDEKVKVDENEFQKAVLKALSTYKAYTTGTILPE